MAGAGAVVADAQMSIVALIYATTWKFHWKTQHAARKPRFVFPSWQNASLVMARAQKQAPHQSLVPLARAMAKCVCSKGFSLFNKPAQPVMATAKW